VGQACGSPVFIKIAKGEGRGAHGTQSPYVTNNERQPAAVTPPDVKYNHITLGSPQLPLVISVQPKTLKFQSARGGQNGRNVNDAEGRAAALHAQSARHDRGPCRIQCGRRWLLRRNCHTPLLLLGTMLFLG